LLPGSALREKPLDGLVSRTLHAWSGFGYLPVRQAGAGRFLAAYVGCGWLCGCLVGRGRVPSPQV